MPISTSETTSFRPTDRIDISDPGAQTAAVYDIQGVARVHVWSTGAVIGRNDDSTTHIGFQIENIGHHGIEFDGNTFELVIFHESGAQLPDPILTSIVPLRPSRLPIPPATGVTLDLYFKLAVRLQHVASMRASWSILAAEQRIVRSTNFVRDDDGPAIRPRADLRSGVTVIHRERAALAVTGVVNALAHEFGSQEQRRGSLR
ncbi:MAG: hypothetical protein M3Y30_04640 [Gemmatimonadota bacterium]|nr:hypothetical protein [Gemmatimonadota bacterium]